MRRRLRASILAAATRAARAGLRYDLRLMVNDARDDRSDARRARLLHAGRMGAARGDLAGLAAQPDRLARQARHHPLGLRRDGAQDRPRRERAHPRRLRGRGKARPGSAWLAPARALSTRRVRPAPHQPGLDARQRADLRPARRRAGAPRPRSCTSTSTPGPSTRTWQRTAACRRRPRGCSRSGSSRRASGAGTSSSKAAASTSTAAARCSPPRSATSPPGSRCATPAWGARASRRPCAIGWA